MHFGEGKMVLYLLPVPGIFSTLVADTVQYDDEQFGMNCLQAFQMSDVFFAL